MEGLRSFKSGVALIAIFCCFSTLNAAQLVVPTREYMTIQSAINASNNGDTVIVAPGRYYENIRFNGKNIVLTSQNPENPDTIAATIIDGSHASQSDKGSTVTFANGETKNAVITGFTITGGSGTLNSTLGIDLHWGAGIYCYNSSPTIKGNVIIENHGPMGHEDGYGGGIGCVASNAFITGNVINSNDTFAGGGISVYSGNPRISSNLIYDNKAVAGGGVVLLYGGLMVNNTIASNDAEVGGNVFARPNTDSGKDMIVNNIICTAQRAGGLYWDAQSDYQAIRNNNICGNTGGNYIKGADQAGINGNISEDPLFVNSTAKDYHIQPQSPCINTGLNFAGLAAETDIDKQPRILSSIVDIGADEFSGYTIHYVSEGGSIQAAIDNSNDNDIIAVYQGEYFENINFKGKSITVCSINPDDPCIVESTIINANGLGNVVKFISGEDSESVLNGFTIMGGYAMGPEPSKFNGAGIYCLNSGPIVKNCIIRDNKAGDAGGGMYNENGSPTIINCIFKNNKSYSGNGINSNNSNPTLINCEFTENHGGNVGGAVYSRDNSNSKLINCKFTSNSSWSGAAMYNNSSFTELQNCIFSGNTAGDEGGAICNKYGSLKAVSCVFAENHADGNGGAMDYVKGSVELINCTIISNTSQKYGGGIRSWSCNIILKNCILWNNKDGDRDVRQGQIYFEHVEPIVNFSCIEDGQSGDNSVYPGAGNIDRSPGLVSTVDPHLTVISPCINAGDPCYVTDPCEVDIDGDARVMFERVDIGADERGGNLRPVADAGSDQSMSSIPHLVTLDGSGSFDLGGDALIYHWKQVDGPAVELSDANSVQPTFVPMELGIYVFELVVSDTVLSSEPDVVGIVIGNSAPIADAGLDRYAGSESITFDGTNSFDPDGYGELSYQWRQVSGAAFQIDGADTANPTVSGFTQKSSVQYFDFELVVSDGDLESEPSVVMIVVVPSYGTDTLIVPSKFDVNKPTIVAFNGGNCSTGSSMTFGGKWAQNANWITTSYGPPYNKYGDMLIVYLSKVAPDYHQPIQTMGYSTGNMPAIDIANRINSTYRDARYAINRISFFDAACRSYDSSINTFLDTLVDGEQCWIDSYIATHSRYYSRTLNITFPGGAHSTPVNWAAASYNEGTWPNGDLYNGGITAGYYYSVIGPGKNLQLAKNTQPYYFRWFDSTPDYLAAYSASYPGRLPEAVTLIGPDVIGKAGGVLTCKASQNSIGYQLLMGANPYYVMDYDLVSDTPNPPVEAVTDLPYEKTWWTVRAYDQYGSTIYADPKFIRKNVTPVANAGTDITTYAWIDGKAKVKLDGSCCYDDDDDTLTYYWSCATGGQGMETDVVNPIIELPVGEHVIQLVVSDGIDESMDEVVVTVVSAIEVAMKFTPQAINSRSNGKWVKAHFVLNADMLPEDIDFDKTIVINEPAGIDSENVNVFVNENGLTEIETIFSKDKVIEYCNAKGANVNLSAVGLLKTGQYFYGRDTITVK